MPIRGSMAKSRQGYGLASQGLFRLIQRVERKPQVNSRVGDHIVKSIKVFRHDYLGKHVWHGSESGLNGSASLKHGVCLWNNVTHFNIRNIQFRHFNIWCFRGFILNIRYLGPAFSFCNPQKLRLGSFSCISAYCIFDSYIYFLPRAFFSNSRALTWS